MQSCRLSIKGSPKAYVQLLVPPTNLNLKITSEMKINKYNFCSCLTSRTCTGSISAFYSDQHGQQFLWLSFQQYTFYCIFYTHIILRPSMQFMQLYKYLTNLLEVTSASWDQPWFQPLAILLGSSLLCSVRTYILHAECFARYGHVVLHIHMACLKLMPQY